VFGDSSPSTSSSPSQNGIPSADTFGARTFNGGGPFFLLLLPLFTETVTTKVELGVFVVTTVEFVLEFVFDVELVDAEVVEFRVSNTFEVVVLLCNHLVVFVLVLFVLTTPMLVVVVLELVEFAVVVVTVTVVFAVTALTALSSLRPPFPPPLPPPFPLRISSPETAGGAFFFFLSFLHVVLIFTFVSTEEASVHCRHSQAKWVSR
jgi:hypothetical protein